MRVLVAYATRHGATAGIAERIAAALTAAGLSAEARPVQDVQDLEPYEAVVLGGAAYLFHWLKPAMTFARRHHRELADRPAIDAWAARIAAELGVGQPARGRVRP